MSLKKINKGAILAAVIVLIIAVYHTTIFVIQMQDKKDATAFLNDYYSTIFGATVLDSKYHDFNVEVPKEILTEKTDRYAADISKFFVTDNKLRDSAKDAYKNYINSQGDQYERTVSQSLKSFKIVRFNKEENKMVLTVSVVLNIRFMQRSYDMYGNMSGTGSKWDGQKVVEDTVSLEILSDGKLLISSGGNGFFNNSYTAWGSEVRD